MSQIVCILMLPGMCQRFVSAAKESSCSGQSSSRSSVLVSIIELKFLQSMPGSVTNQRKVNNAQAGGQGRVRTSPCWPISGHNQSRLTNQGRDRGVGCCHGTPTFLSRPSHVPKWVSPSSNVMTEDVSLRRQHQSSHLTVSDRREIRSRNIPFDNKTLHWHWSLSVPGSLVMLTLIFCIVCIYLIAESVRLFVVMFETLRLTLLASSRCKWIVGFDRGQYYKP